MLPSGFTDPDSTGDRLYRQDPPNAGTLVDVGPLGINVETNNDFDIGGTTGIAYGIFTVSGVQKIYTVNLTTGAATAGAPLSTAVRGFTLGLGFKAITLLLKASSSAAK